MYFEKNKILYKAMMMCRSL